MARLLAGHVLIAHPSTELYGSDLQTVETVRACVEAGARVTVVLPGPGPLVARLEEAGARVVVVPFPVVRKAALRPAGLVRLALGAARALPRAVGVVRRAGADVVLVSTLTVPWWVLAGRLARVRVVVHVHEAEADAPRPVRAALAAPLLLSSAVVANSRAARDVLVGAVGRLARTTRVVHNGVPGPARAPEPRPRSAGDPAHLVLVGRLSPRKGTDVALEALALLRRDGREVTLTLAGTCFAGYEWFERRLRDRAGEPDLVGAVTFAGYADAWEQLAAADVALVPSRVEPFGNVAVEAMLARRPVVASRTQGLAEIVRDGVTGLLVPPGDPRALARAVARLLDAPDQARALARAAHREARERFSVTRYREQVRAVLAPAAAPSVARSLAKLLLTDLPGAGRLLRALARSAALAARNRWSSAPLTGDAPVDLCVTTYGRRAATVHLALESVAAGTVRPRRAILWVDEERLVTAPPAPLRRLRARGLEIRRCEDLGPHKKQFPYVTAGGPGPFVTADDDVLYPRGWLAGLLAAHRRLPGCVVAHRAHRVTTVAGTIGPYAGWVAETATEPSAATLPTGVSGVLYPPAMVAALREAGRAFLAVAPRCDDVWVHAVAVRAGVGVAQVSATPRDYLLVPGTQAGALFQENGSGGGNDQAAAAAYVGEVRRAVLRDAAPAGSVA
ncbi:hypothetical protein DNL40_04840 [Xylanimonas oleitrophica]|uniref:Glycosyltransferase subfamily 4-like N-terminal domain-containing protein n=1 Tax=Xylanimonas oleitrophica TaxID=2607479 RepID=A0A2W5Y7B7_9MICO|nr:glycosyltransferase family 4 protein [Xylanimonas oleitrophica]PZR54244.1 hypothetical protein DNL40_04840 [Xylanimonas oleitrophica]